MVAKAARLQASQEGVASESPGKSGFREALVDSITPKEEQVLCLLKFGMPIDCKVSYGVKKPQKSHFQLTGSKKR